MTDQSATMDQQIEQAIVLVRGQRVMLDSALAALYGVSTKALNQAVARNHTRFPADFMFQLTIDEARRSRSQSVTLNVEEREVTHESSAAAFGRGTNVNRFREGRGTARVMHPLAKHLALTVLLGGCAHMGDRPSWWKVEDPPPVDPAILCPGKVRSVDPPMTQA